MDAIANAIVPNTVNRTTCIIFGLRSFQSSLDPTKLDIWTNAAMNIETNAAIQIPITILLVEGIFKSDWLAAAAEVPVSDIPYYFVGVFKPPNMSLTSFDPNIFVICGPADKNTRPSIYSIRS